MADPTTKQIFKNWSSSFASGAFGIALALLLILVLRSVAVQITPPPGPQLEPYPDVSTQAACEEAGGRWIKNPAPSTDGPRPLPVDDELQSYCQGPLAFERERQQQTEASRQTSLFVFALGGAAAVAGGLFARTIRGVAPGLLLGGIIAFFIAGIHVWQLAPGLGRLATIVAIFIALTGLGIYIFRDQK